MYFLRYIQFSSFYELGEGGTCDSSLTMFAKTVSRHKPRSYWVEEVDQRRSSQSVHVHGATQRLWKAKAHSMERSGCWYVVRSDGKSTGDGVRSPLYFVRE